MKYPIRFIKGLTLSLVVATGLNSCKSAEESPLVYNEKIISIVTKVDSLRLEIGDRSDEQQEETIKDMTAFKGGIKSGLKELDSLNSFQGDSNFNVAAKNYLLTNRAILKDHFVIIATVHDKILNNSATEEEKAYAVKTNEDLNQKLDSANAALQKEQNAFFRKYKIKAKK